MKNKRADPPTACGVKNKKKASMQILNIGLSDSNAKNGAEHKQEWFHLKVERHRVVSSL